MVISTVFSYYLAFSAWDTNPLRTKGDVSDTKYAPYNEAIIPAVSFDFSYFFD